MKITDTHIYFFGAEDFLSNFYPYETKEGRITTSEKTFMVLKALFFEDPETADLIEKSQSPAEAKKLGRQIKNFNKEAWDNFSRLVMKGCLLVKFQNKELEKKLLDTGNRILVEAAPNDLIWGVGLDQNDPLILDEKNWRGTNYLGSLLMMVREEIKKELS